MSALWTNFWKIKNKKWICRQPIVICIGSRTWWLFRIWHWHAGYHQAVINCMLWDRISLQCQSFVQLLWCWGDSCVGFRQVWIEKQILLFWHFSTIFNLLIFFFLQLFSCAKEIQWTICSSSKIDKSWRTKKLCVNYVYPNSYFTTYFVFSRKSDKAKGAYLIE